jgi:hypothetical protein
MIGAAAGSMVETAAAVPVTTAFSGASDSSRTRPGVGAR